MQQRVFTLKKDVVTYRSIAALESLLFMFMILLYAQRDKIPKEVAHYFSANFAPTSAETFGDAGEGHSCRVKVSSKEREWFFYHFIAGSIKLFSLFIYRKKVF